MFGESAVGNVLGVGVLLLFGAYVHYRVTERRTQTRLAVCMLDEDDSPLVAELDRLVDKVLIRPLGDPYEIAATPVPVVAPAASARRKVKRMRKTVAA